jgi:hypothetical protein
MRLLMTFARAYPLPSALMLLALVLAALVEGAGLSVLLPLLGAAASQQTGAEQTSATGAFVSDSGVGYRVNEALGFLTQIEFRVVLLPNRPTLFLVFLIPYFSSIIGFKC